MLVCLQSKMPGGVVSAMATNKANTMLYTADSLGFIYVWDVAKYCLEAPETESPDGERCTNRETDRQIETDRQT